LKTEIWGLGKMNNIKATARVRADIGDQSLRLRHPDTKEPIDLDLMTYEEINSFRALCVSKIQVAKIRLSAIESQGDTPHPGLLGFIDQCGISVAACQEQMALRNNESYKVKLANLDEAAKEVLPPHLYQAVVNRYLSM
jgi:hypothetical protein